MHDSDEAAAGCSRHISSHSSEMALILLWKKRKENQCFMNCRAFSGASEISEEERAIFQLFKAEKVISDEGTTASISTPAAAHPTPHRLSLSYSETPDMTMYQPLTYC